jgi:hypothetical protein
LPWCRYRGFDERSSEAMSELIEEKEEDMGGITDSMKIVRKKA